MAKIGTITEAILLCKEAGVTPWVHGHRGLGKSSLVKQLCERNNWGFIDLRLSQCEASDIRGLPDKQGNRTVYLPPNDMPSADLTDEQIARELGEFPSTDGSQSEILENVRVWNEKAALIQPRFQKGILFLDEINRAADDVMQAVFQLVLDRKVGSYVLPVGWGIVCAGNFMEGYQVNGFSDPAFLNRFCHMVLSAGESTLDEWASFMANAHGQAASDVIEFASQNVKHLDGDVAGEMGFSISPSRRSWEAVVRVTQAAEKLRSNDIVKQEVIAGLVGRDMAVSFLRYSCPVKPQDLINKGVKPFAAKLKTLQRNQLIGLMYGLVSFCKQRIEEDAIAEVCLDFAEVMLDGINDKDVVVAFCQNLAHKGKEDDNLRSVMISNYKLAQMINKFKIKREGGKKQVDFLMRLCERPRLQVLLGHIASGKEVPVDIESKI